MTSNERQDNMNKWYGETTCNYCGCEIKHELYDADTIDGPWATMCPECFARYGKGKLGVGHGQRYVKRPEGFVQVEGGHISVATTIHNNNMQRKTQP